jgi:hypothetical protein
MTGAMRITKTTLLVMFALIILAFALRFNVQNVEAQTSIYLLPNHSGYINDLGYYYIVGEVENNGSSSVTNVIVNATYYNSTGELVGYTSGNLFLELLLSGRKAPFEVTLYSSIDSLKVHYYTLSVAFSPANSKPLGLDIISHSSYKDENGFHITGQIKNVGTEYSSFTRVVATFYNSNGFVIAAKLNYSNPKNLDSNQMATFKITLNSSAAINVQDYALQAESLQYEAVPEFPPHTFTATITIMSIFTMIKIKKKRKFST